MSITRTTVTDDDGTGATGTIANQAWLTTFYDTLDARWSRITITSTGSQELTINNADLIVFNNASDLTVIGIESPFTPNKPAKPLRFVCIGAGNVFLAHQSGSATAANRLVNFVSSGNTPCSGGSASQAGGRGMYVYDDVNSRWQLVAHDQGAWITPTFAGGNYTASAGTWTLAVGDVIQNSYKVEGRTLLWNLYLATTSVSNAGVTLDAVFPGGFTAAAAVQNFLPSIRISDNVVGAPATASMANIQATFMRFYTSAAFAGFAISANQTSMTGMFAFEVA